MSGWGKRWSNYGPAEPSYLGEGYDAPYDTARYGQVTSIRERVLRATEEVMRGDADERLPSLQAFPLGRDFCFADGNAYRISTTASSALHSYGTLYTVLTQEKYVSTTTSWCAAACVVIEHALKRQAKALTGDSECVSVVQVNDGVRISVGEWYINRSWFAAPMWGTVTDAVCVQLRKVAQQKEEKTMVQPITPAIGPFRFDGVNFDVTNRTWKITEVNGVFSAFAPYNNVQSPPLATTSEVIEWIIRRSVDNNAPTKLADVSIQCGDTIKATWPHGDSLEWSPYDVEDAIAVLVDYTTACTYELAGDNYRVGKRIVVGPHAVHEAMRGRALLLAIAEACTRDAGSWEANTDGSIVLFTNDDHTHRVAKLVVVPGPVDATSYVEGMRKRIQACIDFEHVVAACPKAQIRNGGNELSIDIGTRTYLIAVADDGRFYVVSRRIDAMGAVWDTMAALHLYTRWPGELPTWSNGQISVGRLRFTASAEGIKCCGSRGAAVPWADPDILEKLSAFDRTWSYFSSSGGAHLTDAGTVTAASGAFASIEGAVEEHVTARLHKILNGIKCNVSVKDGVLSMTSEGGHRVTGRIDDAERQIADFAKDVQASRTTVTWRVVGEHAGQPSFQAVDVQKAQLIASVIYYPTDPAGWLSSRGYAGPFHTREEALAACSAFMTQLGYNVLPFIPPAKKAVVLGPWIPSTANPGSFLRAGYTAGAPCAKVSKIETGWVYRFGVGDMMPSANTYFTAADAMVACDEALVCRGCTLTEGAPVVTSEIRPEPQKIEVKLPESVIDIDPQTFFNEEEPTVPETNDVDTFTNRFTAGILGEGLADISAAFAAGAKTGAADAFGVTIRNRAIGMFFRDNPPSIFTNGLAIAAVDIAVPAVGMLLLAGLGSAYDAQFGKPGMARAAKGACYWLLTAAVSRHSSTIVMGTMQIMGDLADFGKMMMSAASEASGSQAEQPKLGVSLVPPSAEKERIYEQKAVR